MCQDLGESGSAWVPCISALTPVPSVAVRYFLKNKVSPDLCNEDGLTALHQVRLGLLGSSALCSPPGQVPHVLLFSCPEPSERKGGGELQLPHLKSSCLLWRCVCLLQACPESSCAHACMAHTQPARTGSLCLLHPHCLAKSLTDKASLFGG